MTPLVKKARNSYHAYLIENGVLSIDSNGIPSNADRSSRLSRQIASHIAGRLFAETHEKTHGQTSGSMFETANLKFLRETFLHLHRLRPGKWHIEKLGNRNSIKTSSFVQYEHLEYLSKIVHSDTRLASSLGNDYIIAPDIVIFRDPEPDEFINDPEYIVDRDVSILTCMRESFNSLPILHASISAKWTMRSDRAQNSRTEALGLIRNRKGHLPHIVVITAEPLPSRLASLGLGTGDIDCLYHFALYELVDAVKASGAEDSLELLEMLIEGRRLKDISDLPLDLCV